MPREDQVRNSWEFLRQKEQAGESFSVEELVAASHWKPATAEIYLKNKKLTELTERQGDGRYRVLPRMQSVALDDYRTLFPQARKLFGSYSSACYSDILLYDFFMPLTHEKKLREALDRLFYSDCVQQRVKELGCQAVREELADAIPDGLTDEALEDWVSELVGDTFVGYSISHVNGRFRVENLMTRVDAAELLSSGGSYLADETTAVVRFIMRCKSSKQIPAVPQQMPLGFSAVDEEREIIQWVFLNIFAKAVVESVRGEEEIWLLEQGERPRLWVWEKKPD